MDVKSILYPDEINTSVVYHIFSEDILIDATSKVLRNFQLALSINDIFIPKEKNHVYDNPIGPPIRQEYPLNLSILLSGGKETNKDSVSNCE